MSDEAKAKIITRLANLYAHPITADALELYIAAIQDMSAEHVAEAARAWVNGTQRGFPLPGNLRASVNPSGEDHDREIASRIWGGVSRFGYCNPERAKEFIGPIGWAAVELSGGWGAVCNSATGDGSSVRAQWRDLVAALRRKALAGNDLTALPSEKIPEAVGSVVRGMIEKMGGKKNET